MEKSELWVYKGQGPDEAMDGGQGENEHKKKEVIKLCLRKLNLLIFYENVTASRTVTKKPRCLSSTLVRLSELLLA